MNQIDGLSGDGPGPKYDTQLRWLVANDPGAVCRLLGESPAEPPELLSESLPVNTVFTDALLRVAPDRLLHTEFVRKVEPDLGARMLEYRGRLSRLRPGMTLVQHILVLAGGTVPASFRDTEHWFRLHVTYLRELAPQDVLSVPSLAPMAVLAAASDQSSRLRNFEQSLDVIRGCEAGQARVRELANTAGVLALIHLDDRTMRRAWKETFVNALTREDWQRFFDAMKPADEEERLDDEEYERTLPLAQVLIALMERRFGYDVAYRRIVPRLVRDYDLNGAVDLIDASDSYESLESKL